VFKTKFVLALAILPVLFGQQPCRAEDHVFAKRPQPWQRRDKPILSALTTKQRWSRVTLYSPHVIRVGGTGEVDPLTVTQRFQREGRWKDIEPERNEMMKLARKRFKTKEERQLWVYGELDRIYPTLEVPEQSTEKGTMSPSAPRDDGQIQGLSAIPEAWPELPANASLAAELGWVQANRLRIVEEKSSGPTVVRLDLALSPAPSWAALGWLETSIRSYAKYVDVAAKATASEDGEAAVMRRERMAIEEVRALLEEMREAEG
jgi:hypothetical protein